MAQILFLGGLALVLVAVLLTHGAFRSNPAKVLKVLRTLALGVLGIVLLVLILRGRAGLALVLAPALLPLLMRWRALRQRSKAAGGPSPGQHSDVETRFLRMHLDHDTGELRGKVIDGRYQGRDLDDLDLEELVELWCEYRSADEPSAAVLEAYLDRVHGDDWRDLAGQAESTAPGEQTPRGAMTREEAYEILGLAPGATPEEIKISHRRLMQKLHPDHGGSTYLAVKINQAKDVLLGL